MVINEGLKWNCDICADHEGVGRGRQPVKELAKVRPPGTEWGNPITYHNFMSGSASKTTFSKKQAIKTKNIKNMFKKLKYYIKIF